VEEAKQHESVLQQSLDAELSALEQRAREHARPSTAPSVMALPRNPITAGPEPEAEPEPEPEPARASTAGAFAGSHADDDNVIVVCRVRPENDAERQQAGCQPMLEYGEDGRSVTVLSEGARAHPFGFRRVFGPTVEQQDIFDSVGAPMVDAVLDGFNAAMICYGQTGAGKSYTMLGSEQRSSGARGEDLGLLPRTTESLFRRIRERSSGCLRDVVRASFIEIYMERAADLLGEADADLQIREDKLKNVYVAGARQEIVCSAEEVSALLELGLRRRQTGFTGSNAVSSRSHAVFILTLDSTDSERHITKTSQLYCCDLAGSEKIDKTITNSMTPTEARKVLKEGQKINTSLLALGNVIAALAKSAGTGRKSSIHIPYRDSKLTRLLKNSFGGNARTAVVVCCSPSPLNAAETLSTLRFGDRSQRIKNVATQNVFRSATELQAMLNLTEGKLGRAQAEASRLAEENERLRVALRRSLRGGVSGSTSVSIGGSVDQDAELDMVAVAYAEPTRHTVGAARSIIEGTDVYPGSRDGGGQTTIADGLAVTGMICPLTRSVLYDPVVAADGWTYERSAIVAYWRAQGLRSPASGDRLESRTLVKNRALSMVVNGFFTEGQREAVKQGGRPNWWDYLPHEVVGRIFDWVGVVDRRPTIGRNERTVARDLCRLCQVCRYFMEVSSQPPRWTYLLNVMGCHDHGDSPKITVRDKLVADKLVAERNSASGADEAASNSTNAESTSRTQYGTLRLNAPRHASGFIRDSRVSVPLAAWGELPPGAAGARATPEAIASPR
jgi:hypothetical protein